MKQGSGKGMDISYNTQVVTEAESKMIVDFETTNNGSDKGHLTEMGTRAKEFLETETLVMTADTGYHDGEDMLEPKKTVSLVLFQRESREINLTKKATAGINSPMKKEKISIFVRRVRC